MLASAAVLLTLTAAKAQATPFTVDVSTIYANGGLVGIGTTSPATNLDVNGNAQFGFGATKSTLTADGALSVPYNVNAGSVTIGGASGTTIYGNSSGIGLGTSSPQYLLDVAGTSGNLRCNPSQAASGEIPVGVFLFSNFGPLVLGNGSAGTSNKTEIVYFNGAQFYSALEVAQVTSGFGNLVLMKSGGNVGINISTPSYTLQVNGNAANGTGVWATVSDRQFKSNVNPIQNALETVRKLRGVTFEWNLEQLNRMGFGLPPPAVKQDKKSKGDKKQIMKLQPRMEGGLHRGFIAQDVETVVPEWVKSDARGFKWFEPAGIDAVMVEAIKQVDGENSALREHVEKQQKQIDDLTARIRVLEGAASPPPPR